MVEGSTHSRRFRPFPYQVHSWPGVLVVGELSAEILLHFVPKSSYFSFLVLAYCEDEQTVGLTISGELCR